MALATKCPHCNTIFRVAHDQLKLRGGIVRCGSCNEVFDGNAALLEPLPTLTPLPMPMPGTLPESVQALSLDFDDAPASDPAPALQPAPVLNSAPEPDAASSIEPESASLPEAETETDAEPELLLALEPDPAPQPEPATAPVFAPEPVRPSAQQAWLEPRQNTAPEPAPQPAPTAQDLLSTDTLSDEELQAALEAELAALDARMAAAQPATAAPFAPSASSPSTDSHRRHDERREPTFEAPVRPYELAEDDEQALLELATASHASPYDDIPPSHTLLRAVSAPSADRYDEPQFGAEPVAAASPPSPAPSHTFDQPEPEADTETAAPAPAPAALDDDEPGFMKRERHRERYGRVTTIAFCLGVVLLLGMLAAQGLTTFRNPLAASVPALKPALTAACQVAGCKIELPAQIDALAIEQGELQTLNETTFSFTTALRNAGKSPQQWPHIELVLDDASDKTVLRRVFAPRDYLAPGTAVDQGFPARSEQSVKLYFELKQLKASGYHIAVFYP